jgi:hypothetical protein
MAARKPEKADGVEIYSTRFLPHMLTPRTRERGGKSEPLLHRSTGTAAPPVCYVAWSEYQAVEARAAKSAALAAEMQEALRLAHQILSESPGFANHDEVVRSRSAMQAGLARYEGRLAALSNQFPAASSEPI